MNNEKKMRKETASNNLKARSKRSPEDQIKYLDIRLGKGIGAEKERGRLNKLIEKDK